MPDLPITDGAGNLLALSPAIVAATMAYPDDKRRRDEYIAVQYVAGVLADSGSLSVTMQGDDLRTLLHAPSLAEIEKRAAGSAPEGSRAGDLLGTVVRCRQFCPKHASLSKAAWLEEHTKGPNYRGEKVPSSRAFILESWSRFRAVAPLWAAFRLAQKEGVISPDFDPGTLQGLPAFLATAQHFQLAGEAIKARGQKVCLLGPDVAWKAPPDLRLPDVTVTHFPLSERELGLLEKYRAPQLI